MKKINKFCIKNVVSIFATFCIFFTLPQCYAQDYVTSSDSENLLAAQKKTKAYLDNFDSVFKFVQKNYVDEIDPRILYEGALKGMMDAIGDPYTVYLDSNQMRDLTDTTAGNFGGVGLSISKAVESTPEKPAYVEVASPIEDTPGFRAGIKSGDFIIAIEGESTVEMSMNDVLDRLRGEVGTPVTITILRGKTMKFDVTLVRELIEVPTVKYSMIENTSIGYVRLIKFTPDTSDCLQKALDEFASKGYKGLIIDLRDNPGGLISSVVDIADKFIDKGPIVTTKSRLAFENYQYDANDETKVPADLPIVILINRGSASASEILSGCLKDYHKAYLVGERTYGKGSVQQVIPLSDIDGIKLTMARYYTPSDVNIDKVGIPPDLEIKNLEDFTEAEEKAYLDLISSNAISKTVEENPSMSESQIAKKAVELNKTYPIGERLIRRLLRNEKNRTEETPAYDLDYDLQLLQAIKNVSQPDFSELVRNTKTLKELQDQVQLEESK
ncbi:MAG: S41 family peptidase [Treponema sp.]|nr:S41 family peptidase [Treponema sp.]